MPFGPTYQADTLNQWFGDTAPTVPATYYGALFLNSPSDATLGTALTAGDTYTAITIGTLSANIAAGSAIGITNGTVTQWVQVTAAATAGSSVSVTVQSFVANESYSSGAALTVIQFTEPTTTTSGYSRQSVTNNTTSFPSATTSNGVTTKSGSSSVTLTWGPSTGTNAAWGTVAAVGLMDASSAGNVVAWAPSSTQVNVNGTGYTITEALNNFTLTMTSAN